MPAVQETIDAVAEIDVDKYKYGFSTEIESDKAPKGLNEDIIRFISAKKEEPQWMLDWRLEAFERWKQMDEPEWARVEYAKIDFQDIYYYAAPKNFEDGPKSLDEVDPELLKTYEKLGIPLKEQEILAGVRRPGDPSPMDEDGMDNVYASGRVAVDAVFDSVSVVTTFKDELAKAGVIFCSISEAIRDHPELVQKYLASVVPVTDNYYATLNSAVFTTKLQMCGLRCIEESVQAAREQIRDRERMRTFEMYMCLRNHQNATVLVEAHLKRLVILDKRAHLNCSLRILLT